MADWSAGIKVPGRPAGANAMPLLLTLTSDLDLDDDQVMTQVVGPAGLTIGRGLDNDWIIKDPRRLLSKHHCRLDASGTTFIITDTSTNGVFLNDSPTPLGRGHTAVVGDGDRLRLGELDVVVQAIPEADAAALAGLSADPFPSRSGPFGPGAGMAVAAPGDDDPWGGWVPPGGRGADDEDRAPGRPLGASRPSSGTGLDADGDRDAAAPDGPMPTGDSLFGRAPGPAVDPWGDDRHGQWEDGQWVAAGADADDAAPEALAFVPMASPAPDSVPVSADPAPNGTGGDPIPEDWDAEMADLGIGAGGEPDRSTAPLDADAGPPPLPIPEDFDAGTMVAPPGPSTTPAIIAVLDDCLATFAPEAIETRLPSLGDPDAMPPAVRQARAWVAYEARYPELRAEARRRLAEALGIDPPEDS